MSGFLKKHLIVRILLGIILVLLLIAAGNLVIQLVQTKSAVEEGINNYNIRIAQSYAAGFKTERYVEFLKQPEETDLYWSIRQELDTFRKQIDARYVYLVRFDENRVPLLMIDGWPPNDPDASPINEVTDMPPDAVIEVMAGNPASSPVIDNPKYGSYLSAYVPLKDSSGAVIGALGIDTDVDVFEQLVAKVMWKSLPFYVLMLAVTVLAIGVIIWFVQRALRPLHTVKESAERMAAGDLAEAQVILRSHPVRSTDEIGTVYQAMLFMSENLHSRVRGLVLNMERTSEQLVASTTEFKESADLMLDMGNSLNVTVKTIYEGAHTQKKSAEDSVMAMEEIAHGIAKIAESSATVSAASVEALEMARSGDEAMNRTNQQMQDIQSSAEQTLRLAVQLKGYTEEIERALHAVRSFTDQTKILALNASIEAARAGEHGRGFTVVANEVGKLADASASVVKQITSLLDQIGMQTNSISAEMEVVSSQIAAGVQLSGEAGQSFLHAVRAFRLVSEQIMEVSATTEELSAGSEEVVAQFSSIAHIASEVSAQTQQIQAMSDKQLGMMQRVHEVSDLLNANSQGMRQAIQQVNV
ncbi:methyl-accepting chemotaxis protein [Brevibacillus sp. GCM10020057]|uniref:methyl-accepting chemotaxis protein n=1 Tax=Brevibacillus sp. GCM10020057 TaxID=3317327 RepID=UPI003643D6A8